MKVDTIVVCALAKILNKTVSFLRFYQYLLDCPMSDVRASFAFIIVTLAKLSAPDPLLSLSELNAWTADGYVSYVLLVSRLLVILSALLSCHYFSFIYPQSYSLIENHNHPFSRGCKKTP